jgi:hypothetical protein
MTGKPTKRETSIGFGILLVLAGIVIGVFLKQSHYNPAVLVGGALEAGIPRAPKTDLSGEFLMEVAAGLIPLNQLEEFGPENLSDKINGRAELYLSAGFLRLLCQRFAEANDPSSWMEAFIYDMGTTRRAFAVYSVQRRPDAEKVTFTEFAYRAENALFFLHGRYYLEIIASVTTPRMAEAMQVFALTFIGKSEVQGGDIEELALFPREGLNEEGITFLISNAFGFDRFDNVFMADYAVGSTQLTAFLSMRETPSEASELAGAYHGFLLANGGVSVESDIGVPGAKVVKILDSFEVVFCHGKFLAGIHAAQDRSQAERHAIRLMQKLSEVSG